MHSVCVAMGLGCVTSLVPELLRVCMRERADREAAEATVSPDDHAAGLSSDIGTRSCGLTYMHIVGMCGFNDW